MNDPNPYQPPASPARVSRFARFEQSTLKAYLDHHQTPPTLITILARHFARWVGLSLITVGIGLIVGLSLSEESFVVGMLAGYVLKDCMHARLFVQMWPMLDDIFDWERVKTRYEQAAYR